MNGQTSEEHTLFYFLCRWIVSGAAVLLTSKLVSGFRVSGLIAACFASLLITFANAVLWPVLMILTLPINILTLGLFTFVVNGTVLKICAALMPGFSIETWLAAIWGSIVLSLASVLLHYVLV